MKVKCPKVNFKKRQKASWTLRNTALSSVFFEFPFSIYWKSTALSLLKWFLNCIRTYPVEIFDGRGILCIHQILLLQCLHLRCLLRYFSVKHVVLKNYARNSMPESRNPHTLYRFLLRNEKSKFWDHDSKRVFDDPTSSA